MTFPDLNLGPETSTQFWTGLSNMPQAEDSRSERDTVEW